MAKKKARSKSKSVKKVKSIKKARKPASKAKAATKSKKVKRFGARKSRVVAKKELIDPSLEKIGEATHYFPHVNAAAVKIMKGSLHVGDEIYIKGHTTDFKEQVLSIQLDHNPIEEAKKGMEIGLMVKERVRIGDTIYRIKK